MPPPLSKSTHKAHGQRGVALIIALIVLVAMTMAAITLVRSTDTAALIAGNLAFRQGGAMAGDVGVEAARTWLTTEASNSVLEADSPGNGYYSTRQEAGSNMIDLTGNRTPTNTEDDVAWPGTSGAGSTPKCLAKDGAGNTVCYIINRMCDRPGSLGQIDNGCLFFESTSGTGETSGLFSRGVIQANLTYSPTSWGTGTGGGSIPLVGYYQVTVRIAGPRNNVSFIQTVVLR